MEEETPPPWTYLLVPVYQSNWLHPPLDGGLAIGPQEQARNYKTAFVQTHHIVVFLTFGHIGSHGGGLLAGTALAGPVQINGSHTVVESVGGHQIISADIGCRAVNQFIVRIDVIAVERKARRLGLLPGQCLVCYGCIERLVELFSLHNDGNHRGFASVEHLHRIYVEGYLDALTLCFVVNKRNIVYVSLAIGRLLRINEEEVLQWTCTVIIYSEVGDIIAEFHRFVVHAVGPPAQHRHIGVGTIIGAVAGILEVIHQESLFGLGGRSVTAHAGTQTYFTAFAVIHAYFERAQRTVVAAHFIETGLKPSVRLPRLQRTAILVRTIDEAARGPALAPGIDHQPGAHLVFVFFAKHAVGVQVKLDAVVITHDGHGMIVLMIPSLHT